MWRRPECERAEAGFERGMADELAFHLQSRIDDLVRRGLSPADPSVAHGWSSAAWTSTRNKFGMRGRSVCSTIWRAI